MVRDHISRANIPEIGPKQAKIVWNRDGQCFLLWREVLLGDVDSRAQVKHIAEGQEQMAQ